MVSDNNGGGLLEHELELPSNNSSDSVLDVSKSRTSLSHGETMLIVSQRSVTVASSKSRLLRFTSLKRKSKVWIKNPLNMVLLLWITCVAISGAILFMVMTGMLNKALRTKRERDAWFEVNNQILNALFTLMCLYSHPKRFHHLILLCRWNPKDKSTLRKIYCKNGTYKPHEWAHMVVVVILLHVNCFGQYALCGLNVGFKRSDRPAIGVAVCLSVAIAAPAIAGVYSSVSPLGKEYEIDVEAPDQVHTDTSRSSSSNSRRTSFQRRLSFASRTENQSLEYAPIWKGGLFDFFTDDLSTSYLSLCCMFCVFGYNMERLGFGNMYVHIATFLLFCTAPYWILTLAAVNIDNETVREALGLTGVVLCLFGLFYGGFWRMQMRKKFNLRRNKEGCVTHIKPEILDCGQWLFCCWCSLAQEIRTADSYEIVDDKFHRKRNVNEGGGQSMMVTLPREAGTAARIVHNSNALNIEGFRVENADSIMTPPLPSSMKDTTVHNNV